MKWREIDLDGITRVVNDGFEDRMNSLEKRVAYTLTGFHCTVAINLEYRIYKVDSFLCVGLISNLSISS